MKRLLVVFAVTVWLAPPLPSPACLVPVPYHCDQPHT